MSAAIRPSLCLQGGDHVRVRVQGHSYRRVTEALGDHPRIPEAFLEEQRLSMSHFEYLAEYECGFEAASGAVFDRLAVKRCFDPSVKTLWPSRPPGVALVELVIACDVGKRFDASAVCVAERTSPEPPHTDTSKWPTDWKVPGRQSCS